MKPSTSRLSWLALAFATTACSYDFDSICRTGEVCDPSSIAPAVVREPQIGQPPGCSPLSGACGLDDTACDFEIVGGTATVPSCIRRTFGEDRGDVCNDEDRCEVGLTCVRSSGSSSGICTDLCVTVNSCMSEETTCDRSRRVAVLDGVPVYACVPMVR